MTDWTSDIFRSSMQLLHSLPSGFNYSSSSFTSSLADHKVFRYRVSAHVAHMEEEIHYVHTASKGL